MWPQKLSESSWIAHENAAVSQVDVVENKYSLLIPQRIYRKKPWIIYDLSFNIAQSAEKEKFKCQKSVMRPKYHYLTIKFSRITRINKKSKNVELSLIFDSPRIQSTAMWRVNNWKKNEVTKSEQNATRSKNFYRMNVLKHSIFEWGEFMIIKLRAI
jgi:hypothetical protein